MPNQLVETVCSSSVNHFHLRIGNRCFNAYCMAEVEKGCLMGVSNRATHAFEPGAGDLLMPDRGRKIRAIRARDVEDACFVSVVGPRDVFSTKPGAAAASSVFKSRIAQFDDTGPVPRDFAGPDYGLRQTAPRNERLGVFGRSTASFATGNSGASMSRPALALAVCAVTAAAFWMAGGQALVPQPGSSLQASTTSLAAAAAVELSDRAALLPDPMVTSSIPEKSAKSANGGFTTPAPRPARIERAGSILMIRPAGN